MKNSALFKCSSPNRSFLRLKIWLIIIWNGKSDSMATITSRVHFKFNCIAMSAAERFVIPLCTWLHLYEHSSQFWSLCLHPPPGCAFSPILITFVPFSLKLFGQIDSQPMAHHHLITRKCARQMNIADKYKLHAASKLHFEPLIESIAYLLPTLNVDGCALHPLIICRRTTMRND